jgi:flagellar biosynthesis protein FlhG
VKSIALVSGKGGSGKTMVAVEMAYQLAGMGYSVTLMDADIGTAGMSYYLSLKQVRHIRTGLSTIALQADKETKPDPVRLLQPLQHDKYTSALPGHISFLPIGDHRRINREYQRGKSSLNTSIDLATIIKDIVVTLEAESEVLIVDCRGGIDDESLAVCEVIDDIILIVEPDTTSFQASRHLVDVLTDVDLVHKLHGFIINKVYSNPEAVIRNGTTDFGSQFLGAIPFDLRAARAFLVGDIPGPSSIMAVHVREALSRADPEMITPPPRGRIWKPRDYDMTNIFTTAASRVSVIFALLLLTLGVAFSVLIYADGVSKLATILIIIGISLAGATAAVLIPMWAFGGKGSS